MGKERERSSIANIIGVVLAGGTLIATVITGIPAFIAMQGKEPHVVYEVENAKMLYPEDANRSTIKQILLEKGIPDAYTTLILSNRGDIVAKEVVATVFIPGKFVAETTYPSMESKPAWVKISREMIPQEKPSRIRFNLNELGLTQNLSLKVSFISLMQSNPKWEIFYDGKPAIEVDNIRLIPENARRISFKPTIKILIYGLFLSFFVFFILRVQENIPILRIIRDRSVSKEWRRYKDQIIISLSSKPSINLESATDGSIIAKEPCDFWDGVLIYRTIRIGLEIHTSAQKWEGLIGPEADQNNYCLRLLAMGKNSKLPVNIVALVNDEDIWGKSESARVRSILNNFSENQENLRFVFLSGEASEVCDQLLKTIGVTEPN